jgi:hypothetical protein
MGQIPCTFSGSSHHLGKDYTLPQKMTDRPYEVDQLSGRKLFDDGLHLSLKQGRVFKDNHASDKQVVVRTSFENGIG